MASSNFPTSLDTSSTVGSSSVPAGTDDLDGSPSHADRHQSLADAVVKIETKVGTGSSTAASNEVFVGTGSGTSGWSSDNPLTEELDKNANTKPQAAFASGAPQTLTTSAATITGCSITVTTPRDNMLYVVTGTFDIDIDYTATLAQGQFVGQLQLDGVDESGDARFYFNLRDTGDFLRVSVSQTWVVDMGTAGAHTLRLRGYDSGAGTVQVRALVDTNIAIVGTYG